MNTTTDTTETTDTAVVDKTIVFLSRSIDDERATVAWTLANAGVANGQDVTVFCVSPASTSSARAPPTPCR